MSSLSHIQNAPFQPPVSLDSDFGHSPIGRLGESNVTQKPSVPRQIQKAFSAAGKAISNRTTRLTQSPHARADSDFTKSLQKTSRQIGELLGSLSKTSTHQVDGGRFLELLGNLKASAHPMTEQGADYDQIFHTRLELNIGKMTSSQLVALKDGVELAESAKVISDPEALARLGQIRNAVANELKSRLLTEAFTVLTPIINEACGQVERNESNPGAVDYIFDKAGSKAADLLRKYGQLSGVSHDQEKSLERALIKDAIENSLQAHDDFAAEIREMLTCLSSRTLYELDQTTTSIRTQTPKLANTALKDCIADRMSQAESGFIQSSNLLNQHSVNSVTDPTGPLLAPQSFAKEVMLAAKNLSIIQKHGDIHHLQVGEDVDTALASTVEHLNELMKPSNLLLGELNHEQLRELGSACKTLGVDRPAQAIKDEIARRKNILVAQYQDSIHQLADAARQGDTTQILSQVIHSKKIADQLHLGFQKLGEKIDDADKIMAFRTKMLSGAIDSLDEDEALALHGALLSSEMRSLASGMVTVAYSLIMPEGGRAPEPQEEAVGKRIFDASNDIEMIRTLTHDFLELRGISLPPLADGQQYDQADITPTGRKAIKDVFKVEPHSNKGVHLLAGIGSETVQQSIVDGLAKPLSPLELSEVRLNTGLQISMSHGMHADMNRSTYTFAHEDGSFTRMLDKERYNQGDTALQNQLSIIAAESLVNFCDGDRDMAFFVSKFAHQGILFGLQSSLVKGTGPIRLPDGSSGQLMGAENTTYTMSKDEGGDIRVRVNYSITNATQHLNFEAGTNTPLDPEKSSASFTFEVTFTRDRQVKLTGPLEFAYSLTTV